MMKIHGKFHPNGHVAWWCDGFLSSSEYLIRINTEAQFTFPMVRVKLLQDSAINIGSDIQG